MSYMLYLLAVAAQALDFSQICLINGSRLSYLFMYVHLVVVISSVVLKQICQTSLKAHHQPKLEKYSKGYIVEVILISCLQLLGNVFRFRADIDSIYGIFLVVMHFKWVLLFTGCSQPTPQPQCCLPEVCVCIKYRAQILSQGVKLCIYYVNLFNNSVYFDIFIHMTS